MEKFQIFEQVRGPTFLEKFNFFTFLKKHFYSPDSLSFYLEYQQKIFPCFFFEKTKNEKNSNFKAKSWTNPFGKIWVFIFLKKHLYSLESLSFHLEYQLKYISRLMFSKNKQWKNFEFLTKTFEKIQFFLTFSKKDFIVYKALLSI